MEQVHQLGDTLYHGGIKFQIYNASQPVSLGWERVDRIEIYKALSVDMIDGGFKLLKVGYKNGERMLDYGELIHLTPQEASFNLPH